ncbi:MAG: hypothetical protein KA144_02900 [Xanthomonadaceae bacterium]|nr:hypothetical protein [Xanthomonadaceae bacterium]
MRYRSALCGCLLLLPALFVGGCGRDRPGDIGAASEPAAAVLLLAAHLRANDLNAFAHAAAPPELQAPLQQAWRENRSRWPLDELPFGERAPAMLQALAAPKSEATLRRAFDRQFANANRDIHSAAATLGLFGTKFVQKDPGFSEDERAHYTQLIGALSEWGKTAKLGDPQRARRSIAQLTAAARRSGLAQPEDFQRYGMEDSLRRLGPVFGSLKTALGQYGLDLDRSFEQVTVTVESQDGDTARVRVRYPLGNQRIDTVIALQRIGQRWYLRDHLRHAREAAAPAALPAAPEGDPTIGPPPALKTTEPKTTAPKTAEPKTAAPTSS